MHRLTLGTYKVTIQEVSSYIEYAKLFGVSSFDTAQLYKNEKYVVEACDKGIPIEEYPIITTKIYNNVNTLQQLRRRIKQSSKLFSTRPSEKNILLLHNPMPVEYWKEMVEYNSLLKTFGTLGVSNYGYDYLLELLTYCDENNIPYPAINQIELHPFIDTGRVVELCRQKGITVQAHTIFLQGKFFDYPPLVEISSKTNLSTAFILVLWVLSKGVNICVRAHDEHLQELIHAVVYSDDYLNRFAYLEEMNTWHAKKHVRLYTRALNSTPSSVEEGRRRAKEYAEELLIDKEKQRPSILCEHIPSYCNVPLARFISEYLFPESTVDQRPTLYRRFIKQLRTKRIETRISDKLSKKGMFCTPKRRLEGEYDENIVDPRPMPVNVTDPIQFQPFFEFLTSSKDAPTHDTLFIRGAMFPDGRMDLCKQVVGPSSIGLLCKTVRESTIVKHFLLGNNVALQDNKEEGAKAIAETMRDKNSPIETWYLAGNCIDGDSVGIMCEALQNNTVCKALWLKRNPVKANGCLHLNSLLRLNTTLVLLDLHNCGIGNEGVKNLFNTPENIRTLKHVYLDSNAIEAEGVNYLSEWCKTSRVVTLYISINRLGDDAIEKLCNSLTGKSTLKRLCLASTHMNNRGLKTVVDMTLTCPKLMCVNVGCYKSSADLGEHPGNFFDDESLPILVRLLTEHKSLQYLSTSGCRMSEAALLSLPRLDTVSMDLGKGPWHHPHEKDALRFVKQPKRVVHIDSIYRNRM